MPRPRTKETAQSRAAALKALYEARRAAVLKSGIKEGTRAFEKAMMAGNQRLLAYAGSKMHDSTRSSRAATPARPAVRDSRPSTRSNAATPSSSASTRTASTPSRTGRTGGSSAVRGIAGAAAGVAAVAAGGAAAGAAGKAAGRRAPRSTISGGGRETAGSTTPRGQTGNRSTSQTSGPSVSGNSRKPGRVTVRQKVDAIDRQNAHRTRTTTTGPRKPRGAAAQPRVTEKTPTRGRSVQSNTTMSVRQKVDSMDRTGNRRTTTSSKAPRGSAKAGPAEKNVPGGSRTRVSAPRASRPASVASAKSGKAGGKSVKVGPKSGTNVGRGSRSESMLPRALRYGEASSMRGISGLEAIHVSGQTAFGGQGAYAKPSGATFRRGAPWRRQSTFR